MPSRTVFLILAGAIYLVSLAIRILRKPPAKYRNPTAYGRWVPVFPVFLLNRLFLFPASQRRPPFPDLRQALVRPF
jgi:hypothetical protein